MTIITTTPIELGLDDGRTWLMQRDPTNTPAFADLLEIEVVYTDAKKRAKAHQQMVDGLAAMAHTPDDAETIRALDVGTAVLKALAEAYVREVTGFPTQPAKRSGRA